MSADADAELSPEDKAAIDAMSVEHMIRKWRFAPVGTFGDDPYTRYFQERMLRVKTEDPDTWVAASKLVGWGWC